MLEEDINAMYIQNMNEAKRIELELKNMDRNDMDASFENDSEIEDYHLGINNDQS